MKKVLVTQRVVFNKKFKTFRDAIDHELINFLIFNKYLPILISNTIGINNDVNKIIREYFYKFEISGVILSGGNDLGEFKSRDNLEFKILKFCKKNKVPVLGICRGMQLMSKFDNNKIIKINNHVGKRHNLYNVSGKFISNVNSYHNWTIDNNMKSYNILYRSKDQSIEAIVHKKLKWEGWMWHPEREKKYSKLDINRLNKLFK